MAQERVVQGEELRAAIEARRELGEELEPQLIDSFVERIERRVDARVRERLPRQRNSDHDLAVTIVSLLVAVPLIAIAGGIAGLPAIVAVCAALVLVNVVARR